MVASAVEFMLEGLHLSKRLNKDADHRAPASTYRAAADQRTSAQPPNGWAQSHATSISSFWRPR